MNRPSMIFGASGLLGSRLVRLLDKQSRFPVAIIHKRKGDFPESIHTDEASVGSFDRVAHVMHRYRPGLVINCAAYTDVDGCERDPQRAQTVNTVGAENIARVAADMGVPFVLLSTDYVFDGTAGPYDETAHPHPINEYGRTKHNAETAVRKAHPDSLIIRAGSFIGVGPKGHPSFIERIIDRLVRQEQVLAPIDQMATVAEVSALAQAILTLVDAQASGIWHLGSAEVISRYDLCTLAAEIFGYDTELIEPVMFADLDRAAPRPLNGGLDPHKAMREHNIKSPSPRRALELLRHDFAARG